MSDGPPPISQPRIGETHESEGKPAALIAWGLYILSIPSVALLAPIGLLVAYAARGSATGLPRQHLDAAIALFWSVFWWTAVAGVLIIISVLLSWLILPIVLIFILWGVLFLLGVWFTIKSVLGVINLLQGRAP